MRLLLDTHAWLWQLLDAARLSSAAATALEDPKNELHLSPISVWETLMLADRGRLELVPDAGRWVRAALGASPTQMAELTHEVALRSTELPGYAVRDPADRFIVATALVNGLTVVTADRAMRRYRGVTTLW